jgi:hypothetical protein
MLSRSILNKITPEKFEKLSDQIVQSGIESAELLRGVISLIFDKAVAEPTFCALYARLCVKLSKALPEFPPLEGEDKPMTFRRILLNTCQEEFEGAEKSRAAVLAELAETPDVTPEEREYKMRKVIVYSSPHPPHLMTPLALEAQPLAPQPASKTDATISLGPRGLLQLLGLQHRCFSALSAWQPLSEMQQSCADLSLSCIGPRCCR